MAKFIIGIIFLTLLGFGTFYYYENEIVNPSNARIIDIPQEVYSYTGEKDFFYEILHNDKRYIYVMYSKSSQYSQKFLKTISNAVEEKPLKKYYTLKSQAIQDRPEPQVEKNCKSYDDCQEKMRIYNYTGNVWFNENCGSFCIIDNHKKRVLTPDISTESKEAINREKALNFLNDTIRHK